MSDQEKNIQAAELQQDQASNQSDAPGQMLNLNQFFPYRLRRLYVSVVRKLEDIYSDKFGLSGDEWRALTILVREKEITNREIVALATIDKVAVSRAIRKLRDKALVDQRPHEQDGRSVWLSPSTKGRALYREITPYMLALEDELLGELSQKETAQLLDLFQRVEAKATSAP